MIETQTIQHQDVETDHSLIRSELDRLLGERRFAGAPQMSAFLRYIVNETLAGNANRIKAFSVGVDALGKPDSFDAQTDPSVRVLALRLRKTLDAIYEDPSAALVIIKLKVGTYVPTFFMVSRVSAQAKTEKQNFAKSNVVAQISSRPTSDTRRDEGIRVGSVHMERSMHTPKASVIPESKVQDRPFSGALRYNDTNANKKWLIAAAAVLFFAAWQIAVKNSDVQAGGYSEAPLLMSVPANGSEIAQTDESLRRTTARDQPTIVVNEFNNALEFERRITLLLTSTILESGTVGVVQISNGQASWVGRPGEYQLLVSSYQVADQVRVNTQIVSLWDGELLFTETVVLDQVRHFFSDEDLTTIETLATGLTSEQGPLFEDYCSRYGTDGPITLGCSTT